MGDRRVPEKTPTATPLDPQIKGDALRDAVKTEQQKIAESMQKAEGKSQSGEAGLDGKPDPNKIRELSGEHSKIPTNAADRASKLQQHKQDTATTGLAGKREITDAQGNVLKGQESFDKKTGQRMFYKENADGSYSQYKFVEGGRSLQAVDASGKPTGDTIRVRNDRAVQNERGTSEVGDESGKRGPNRAGLENSEKGKSSEKGATSEGEKPGRQRGPQPERPTHENPEVGKSNFRPKDGEKKEGGSDSSTEGDRGRRAKPADSTSTPTVNPYDNGVQHRKLSEPQQNNNNFEPGRPRQNTTDQTPRQTSYEPPRHQRTEEAPRSNDGRRDDSRRDDAARHSITPEQYRQMTPEQRRQFHDERQAAQQNQGDRSQFDGRRAETYTRPQIPQNPHAPNPQIAARPEGARPEGARPEGARPDLGGVGRPETGWSRQDAIARAQAQEQGLGRLSPANEAKFILDMQNGSNRANMLSMLQKFEEGKLGGQGREAAMNSFLKGLRPNELSGLKDFLAADGKQAGVNFLKLDGRTQVNLQEMLTLSAKTSMLEGRVASGRMLDVLGTREGLDRVPSAEQSRLFLKELMVGKDGLSQKGTMTGLPEQLNLTRTLGQRESEVSAQKAISSLVLKGEQSVVVKELIDKVASRDLISKDTVVAARIEPVRAMETSGRAIETASANLELNARVIDRSHAASSADIAAQKVVAETTRQEAAKLTDVARPAERAVDAAIAQAAAARQSETLADNSSKYGMPAEDKTLNTKTEKEKETEKLEPTKRELTPEEMSVLLARKLKEQADKKGKEKDQAQETAKKDPNKKSRTRYRVRQNDTLHAIAAKFLHDEKLAAAIYHLNRNVIPLTNHAGKHFANPQVNSMIWLPGDDDIESFKSQGIAKKYIHIGFKGVKYGSVEEELSSRFGDKWTAAESAANDERRANIEKVLGSFSKDQASDGRARYTSRLGDSLKSIALKHPALQQVDLWKLLASVNELSTATDSKGTPEAVLRRGMILVLPTAAEIEKFKTTGELASPNTDAPNAETENETGKDEVVAKQATAALHEDSMISTVSRPITTKQDDVDVSKLLTDFSPKSEGDEDEEDLEDDEDEEDLEDEEDDEDEEDLEDEEEDEDVSAAAFMPGSQTAWNKCFDKFRAEATARNIDDLENFMSTSSGDETLILSENARLVASGNSSALQNGYQLSLEVLSQGNWESVVKYDIAEAGCTHQTFDGSYRRSRPLNLPQEKVFELAKNDIARNWQEHVSLFAN